MPTSIARGRSSLPRPRTDDFVRRLVVVWSDLEALGYSAGQTASFTMSIQPAGLRQPVETVCENDCEGLQIFPRRWWSQTGSNRRPQACKASALPTELWPHWKPLVSVEQTLVGPGRFELPTPRLSSVCSNQLSYGPSPAAVGRSWARNHLSPSLASSKSGPGGERFTEEKRGRR